MGLGDRTAESRGEPVDLGELIPRLQRFYGGDPVAWFDAPPWVLRVYSQMLLRLSAEEALMDRAIALSGSGRLKKHNDRQFVNALEQQASDGRKKPADLGRLKAAGIKVRRGSDG